MVPLKVLNVMGRSYYCSVIVETCTLFLPILIQQPCRLQTHNRIPAKTQQSRLRIVITAMIPDDTVEDGKGVPTSLKPEKILNIVNTG